MSLLAVVRLNRLRLSQSGLCVWFAVTVGSIAAERVAALSVLDAVRRKASSIVGVSAHGAVTSEQPAIDIDAYLGQSGQFLDHG